MDSESLPVLVARCRELIPLDKELAREASAYLDLCPPTNLDELQSVCELLHELGSHTRAALAAERYGETAKDPDELVQLSKELIRGKFHTTAFNLLERATKNLDLDHAILQQIAQTALVLRDAFRWDLTDQKRASRALAYHCASRLAEKAPTDLSVLNLLAASAPDEKLASHAVSQIEQLAKSKRDLRTRVPKMYLEVGDIFNCYRTYSATRSNIDIDDENCIFELAIVAVLLGDDYTTFRIVKKLDSAGCQNWNIWTFIYEMAYTKGRALCITSICAHHLWLFGRKDKFIVDIVNNNLPARLNNTEIPNAFVAYKNRFQGRLWVFLNVNSKKNYKDYIARVKNKFLTLMAGRE